MLVCDWCGTPEHKRKVKQVPTSIPASNSDGGVMTKEELCTDCRQAINKAIRELKEDRMKG